VKAISAAVEVAGLINQPWGDKWQCFVRLPKKQREKPDLTPCDR